MPSPRRFDPADWERLLSPERRARLDPGALLDALDVAPGSTVADVGAGPGFLTGPLAERVGAAGRVIALDVSPEMIARLRARPLPPHVDVRLSVVLEWVPQDERMGPPPHERIAAADAVRLLTDRGFALTRQGLANPSNYYLVASGGSAPRLQPSPTGRIVP